MHALPSALAGASPSALAGASPSAWSRPRAMRSSARAAHTPPWGRRSSCASPRCAAARLPTARLPGRSSGCPTWRASPPRRGSAPTRAPTMTPMMKITCCRAHMPLQVVLAALEGASVAIDRSGLPTATQLGKAINLLCGGGGGLDSARDAGQGYGGGEGGIAVPTLCALDELQCQLCDDNHRASPARRRAACRLAAAQRCSCAASSLAT